MLRALLAVWIVFGAVHIGDCAETGTIVGQLADPRGQITLSGEVVVFLCDQSTGMPLLRSTRKPLEVSRPNIKPDDYWLAVTSERGEFEFVEVPVGKYRLLAQSWAGTRGLAKFPGSTSSVLVLNGVVENVEVRAGERTVAYPRQLGNGVLRIVNDPEEAHAFLLLSLKPTLGDGILGPAGWGDEFLQQLVGISYMEVPYLTVIGVPDEHPLYAGLFNIDNNPGVGAATFPAGSREGRIRILASWSDGHKDPPPELAELTAHVKARAFEPSTFLEAPEPNLGDAYRKLYERMRAEPQGEVEVPGLGKRKLVDVVAALAYASLQKTRAEIERRRPAKP